MKRARIWALICELRSQLRSSSSSDQNKRNRKIHPLLEIKNNQTIQFLKQKIEITSQKIIQRNPERFDLLAYCQHIIVCFAVTASSAMIQQFYTKVQILFENTCQLFVNESILEIPKKN